MKWLIVGTSGISDNFIKGLKSNGEVAYAILSRTLERAKEYSQKHGIKKSFENLDKALEVVDAVYVATPNAKHYKYAKEALKNKKHVIVEKIMTSSLKETQELFELSKKHQVYLMESYAHINSKNYINFVFPKDTFIEIDFMRKSGKIENNTQKEASTFKKETFGGVIPDIGVYPLSFLIYHLGKVQDIKLSKNVYYNDVLIETKMEITFKKNKAVSNISKINNGNDKVLINSIEVPHISSHGGEIKNRFEEEIYNFVHGKNLQKLEEVSLEVARVVELLKPWLFK